MNDFFQLNGTILWWSATASIFTFFGTLIVVPMLVAGIPPDYFSHEKRHIPPWSSRHPVLKWLLIIGKNGLGYLFICVGILMLVLPGQGILTILIGVMLIDFPGKYRFERWLVVHRPVLRSINWLRRRAKRDPLIIPFSKKE